jgi:hypothetical protein
LFFSNAAKCFDEQAPESFAPMNLRSPHSRWQSWLLWAGVPLLAIGFITERSWQSLPLPRVLETLVLATLALLVAALLRQFLRTSLASALLCVFTAALTCFVGVLPVLALSLLAGAGWSLGSAIAGNFGKKSMVTITGVGAIAGALGWLLPFPVHYRFVYFSLLSILFAARARYCRAALRDGLAAWRAAVDESPAIAAFAALVVGLASTGCWLPTVQFDDLAYHLGLPSQLAALGYYRMDVHSQIWALAPWSGDIVQAVAQLLAGEEARGAVDAFWLFAAGMLTWQLAAALEAPTYARWLAVALFASLPLTTALVGGMQAELPATAATLALALNVTTSRKEGRLRQVFLFAMLAGFLLGLKTGFVAIIIPLGAWLAWRWRGQSSWKMLIAGCALTFAVCGSSYIYAAMLTGNPVFPLLNGFFHSSLFDGTNFADPRWTAPVGLDILWQLTFQTQAYLEGWDGAAGFSLLGLSGAMIVALALRGLRSLALAALIALVAAITAVPYFRYVYPALMLLTPVAVAAVARIASRRHAAVLLICLGVLNLAYQSCSYWTLHIGGVKRRLSHWNNELALERLAPERILIQTVRGQDAAANVLFCSPGEPFAAELAGHGFVTAWYDPDLRRARELADADPSGDGWRNMFAHTDAHYAIVSDATPSAGLLAALADAQQIQRIGEVQLWKLSPSPATGNDLSRERDLASMKFRP